MVDLQPEFEHVDIVGETKQYNGNATTSAAAVPSIAGTAISEVLVRCKPDQANSLRLQVSFDGGTTYFTLLPGEFVGWSIKGRRTQIHLKALAGTVAYEIVLNREPT